MSLNINVVSTHGLSLAIAPMLYDAQPQKPVEDKRDGNDHGPVVVIGSGRPQNHGCNRRPIAPNHHGGACVSPDPRDFFPEEQAPDTVAPHGGKTTP